MRIVVPSGAGLGAHEIYAMRRLSPGSLALVADELGNPASWPAVRRVLRAPDVERAVADEVSRTVALAVAAITPAVGLGDWDYDGSELADVGFGNFFKRIGKAIKRTAKKVVSIQKKIFVKPLVKAVKITEKTAKRVEKFQGRAIKKVGKAIKPFIPIIITVAGAVLSPFTGGASLAVAAALNAGYTIAMKAKQARAAKKANRKEAAAMQAEVKAASADLNKQLDDLFAQNQGVFAAAGISQAQWSAMSTDQKLAVVERINSGQMPSTQENATAAADATGQTAPTQTQTWKDAIKSSPVMQQWSEAAGDTDAATEGIQTPTGTYDVYVEGQKVGSAGTFEEASGILASSSKAGDRVEMTLNGKSLGLKIVTAGGGVISVPPELEAQVRAASRDEVDGIISRATQGAATTTTTSSSGGGMWTLLLLGGGALALAAGGKKR
jgi:hypothetical protein